MQMGSCQVRGPEHSPAAYSARKSHRVSVVRTITASGSLTTEVKTKKEPTSRNSLDCSSKVFSSLMKSIHHHAQVAGGRAKFCIKRKRFSLRRYIDRPVWAVHKFTGFCDLLVKIQSDSPVSHQVGDGCSLGLADRVCWNRNGEYCRSYKSNARRFVSKVSYSQGRRSIRRVQSATIARIAGVVSLVLVLGANAVAAEATMRVMAHPRIVRIVLEGEDIAARHFEQTGPVARLSFSTPVHLSVPSVPAAARPWLKAAELREDGRLLALALGSEVRAQLASARPGRLVVDLEITAAGHNTRSRPEAGAGEAGNKMLRVRLTRHREHRSIVFEGEGVGNLVARSRPIGLDLFGPPTMLAKLAPMVSSLGEPILGIATEAERIVVRLPAGIVAHLRQAGPNEMAVDLVPSGQALGGRRVEAANSRERVSSGQDRTGQATALVSNPGDSTLSPAGTRKLDGRPDRALVFVGAPCRDKASQRFLCIRGRISDEESNIWLIAAPRPRLAAFSRGDSVWIVLDSVFDETDVYLDGPESVVMTSWLQIHSLSDATVLQLQPKKSYLPHVVSEVRGWRLLLRPDPHHTLIEEAQLARLADPPSLSIATSGRPIILPVRLIGSELVVVPTDAPAPLPEPRRLVDLELLASGQGLVWRPAVDDLEAHGDGRELVVSRPGGLNLDLRDQEATEATGVSAGGDQRVSTAGAGPVTNTPDVVLKAGLQRAGTARRPTTAAFPPTSNGAPTSVGSTGPDSGTRVVRKTDATDLREELGPALPSPRSLDGASSVPALSITRTNRLDRMGPIGTSTPSRVRPAADTGLSAFLETASGRWDREPAHSAGNFPDAKGHRLEAAVVEAGTLGGSPEKHSPAVEPSTKPVTGVDRGESPATGEKAARVGDTKPPANRAATSPIGLLRRDDEPERLAARKRAELLERRARSEAGERAVLGVELARIELARGRAAEGLAFLDVASSVLDPHAEPPSDIAVRALSGVAGVLLGRPEAAERLLADRRLDGDAEAALWRGVAAGLRQDWARAARALAESGRSFQGLSPALQRRLAPIVARALLEDGRPSTALALVGRVRRLDLDHHEIQKLALVEGLAHAREGKVEEALAAFRAAGTGPDRTTSIEANYRGALFEFAAGRKTAEQASQDLERQRLGWRGHPMEAEMLDELTQLQLAAGKLDGAIATALDRRARRPDTPLPEPVARRVAESLQAVIERAAQGKGDPLAALRSLRTAPDLLPGGERGAALARALGARLARDGFPGSAASVLEDHGLPRVEGAARAELLLDIAELRLRAGETAEARATLERLESEAVRASALRTRADGLRVALGTPSPALPESGSPRLSPAQIVEAAWQARDWKAVIDGGERLLVDEPSVATATRSDTDKRTVLLRVAFAHAAMGDRATARTLLHKQSALLAGTPEATLAALITESVAPMGNATAVAQNLDAELAALRKGLSLAR